MSLFNVQNHKTSLDTAIQALDDLRISVGDLYNYLGRTWQEKDESDDDSSESISLSEDSAAAELPPVILHIDTLRVKLEKTYLAEKSFSNQVEICKENVEKIVEARGEDMKSLPLLKLHKDPPDLSLTTYRQTIEQNGRDALDVFLDEYNKYFTPIKDLTMPDRKALDKSLDEIIKSWLSQAPPKPKVQIEHITPEAKRNVSTMAVTVDGIFKVTIIFKTGRTGIPISIIRISFTGANEQKSIRESSDLLVYQKITQIAINKLNDLDTDNPIHDLLYELNESSPTYNTTYGAPPTVLQTRLLWSNVIYGLLFISIGLLEVFYGYKYIRITLLVMGFLFWSSTATVIILMIDNAYKTTHSVFFYFIVWLSVGTIGGLLSFFCWHLGLMLTAAYGAFAFSISLLAVGHIQIVAIRYTIVGISITIACLITHIYLKDVIIVSTSIGGSFTVLYGIDEFIRIGFRDSFQLFFTDGEWRFTPNAGIYVLIACGFVLAVCGIIYEYKSHQVVIPDIKWTCGWAKDVQNDEKSNGQEGPEKPNEVNESISKSMKSNNVDNERDLETGISAPSVRDEREHTMTNNNDDGWVKSVFVWLRLVRT
ncbi:11257_t:CDS:10 [Paraglomus occultum]|uniref:Transmembrane protein 198 n=1 Tax=Paraglomus occultum TaxID=144539 RepID=A0A9N8W1G2_9GLOM|nr:11257_t:CDS:10 [Paraglomus occultum]